MISFGPWRPDAANTNAGVCQLAENVLPQSDSSVIAYGPMPSLQTTPTAQSLPGAARGAVSLVTSTRQWKAFVGTATDIYELDGAYGWSSVGSGFEGTVDMDWSFLHFGAYLLASNTTDGMQAINVETGDSAVPVAAAPKAAFIFTSGNVVFALNCDGDDRLMLNSALNDHTNWTTGGADSQPFADGGSLVAGWDLSNGAAIILQERAVHRLQFGDTSGGFLYSLAKIADGIGAVGPRSVVGHNGLIAFLGTNGFYKTDGASVTPIGAQKVDEWFLHNLAPGALRSVQGAVDPRRKMFWWRFKSADNGSDTIFADMIGYNWQLDEWVSAKMVTGALFAMATPGYTLENLDAFGPLDDLPYSLDSAFWQGGEPTLAALSADLKIGVFGGDSAPARLETGISNTKIGTAIVGVTPITDAPAMTSLGVSDDLAQSLDWGPNVPKQRDGSAPVRGSGLNMALRMIIPGNATWTYARGFDHLVTT